MADKGLESPLEGRADVLIVPDIEAGNVLYKTLGLLVPGARFASLLLRHQASRRAHLARRFRRREIDSLALAALRVLAGTC